ncbi:MAG: NifU family protein [Candidatus Sumerlaeia bacterium]|nr:NifU family protein [Candidatus Sumerlaeia bacterium]
MAVTETTEARCKEILEEIRPYIQADGGDVVFNRIEDDILHIELHGACVGCASSLMTLKMGIERKVTEELPEIKAVEMV